MYPENQYLSMYHLVCVHCGATYPADEIIYNCKRCGHLLAVNYPLDEITVKRATWNARTLSVWRYKELLPVHIEPVSLQEGVLLSITYNASGTRWASNTSTPSMKA